MKGKRSIRWGVVAMVLTVWAASACTGRAVQPPGAGSADAGSILPPSRSNGIVVKPLGRSDAGSAEMVSDWVAPAQSGPVRGGGVGVGSGPVLGTGGPSFDIDAFEANLVQRLEGQSAGYAYAISLNRHLARQGAGGKLRKAGEGDIDHAPDLRQNVASISKTITAVAVLRLMEALNLDLDDPIAPWLPERWTQGPNVDQLTFWHLFRHHSGFSSKNSDFWNTLSEAGLSSMVAQGANPIPAADPQVYLNANFALFRFMIPKMWAAAGSPYPANADNETAAYFWYIFYLQNQVFEPIGVPMAQCVDPDPATEALFYDPAAALAGVPGGNWNPICGSGGWVLSAIDLLNFMVNARYNDAILSPAMRNLMTSERLGLYRNSGDHGSYYSHGGSIGFGGGQGMVMCLMRFSIEVEAAVVLNSQLADAGANLCPGELTAAFDGAWH